MVPLKNDAISSMLCHSDVKTHAHSTAIKEWREAGEERRRGGEKAEKAERRRDLLLCTRVLRAITKVLLLFTRVFKWYPLKPMYFQGRYVIQLLKPMHTATKNRKKDHRKCQKLLKPMRLCTKDERKEHRTRTRRS